MVAYASPGGSDRWNKQGLSRKAGSAFVCLLKMTNAPAEERWCMTAECPYAAGGL